MNKSIYTEIYQKDIIEDNNLSIISDPQSILNVIQFSELGSNTPSKIMNSSEEENQIFIECSLCQHKVLDKYLTIHIGKHIQNRYVEDTTTNIRVSNEVVKSTVENKQSITIPKESFYEIKENELREFMNAIPLSKIDNYPKFSFRKIKNVSVTASCSKNRRYSDYAIMVWLESIPVAYNAGFVGGSNSYYANKSSERIQIHLTYDSLEEYYTIAGRAIKKSEYSEYESEEGAIPDRLCNQDELFGEITNILLFFRISPRAALKRYLVESRKGFDIIKSNDDVIQTCTTNHSSIIEELKKSKSSYKYVDDDDDYHTRMYGV